MNDLHLPNLFPSRLLGLLAIVLVLLCHPAVAADRRIAFVIGNASYANEAPLTNPVRDARLLADVLRKDLGFTEVVEKRDLTRAQLYDLVDEIGRKSRGADAVVVYYSGHGMRAVGGNYLIPVDAHISEESHVRRDGIAASELVDAMKDSDARVALLVLDACRNNPYSLRTRGSAKGLARMNVSGGNVLVAYATSENSTADDGASGNSPYALALAQNLKDSGKPILIQFDAVRRQVREATGGAQNPSREGDLEASVYLLPQNLRPTPEPAVVHPGAGGVDLGDLETQKKVRAEWVTWQGKMQADFDRVAGFRDDPELQVKALERFLVAYASNNPFSSEDERLRGEASKQKGQLDAQLAQRRTVANTPLSVPGQASGGRGQIFKDCADCAEMVVIPAGSFMMGSPENEPGRGSDESPPHSVSVAQFAMGRYEVTQGQWKSLMENNPSYFKACGDDCPVENVSWNDAKAYILKLNQKTGKKYRLPSEVEWEYAGRAGTDTAFSTGQTVTSAQASIYGGPSKTTHVGSYAPNGFGLYDMIGNVSEWAEDCYASSRDGSAWKLEGCSLRVFRGGGWSSESTGARSAIRGRFSASFLSSNLGLRLARTLP